MDKQFSFLCDYLKSHTILKWHIIRDLESQMPPNDSILFSTARKTDYRYPFDSHLGYLSLKDENKETEDASKKYSDMIIKLVGQFLDNPIVLGNIFIIILRSDFNGDNNKSLIERFVAKIGIEQSVKVFSVINNSLSEMFYRHDNGVIKNPKNLDDWFILFRGVSYLDFRALEYNNIIKLVAEECILDLNLAIMIPPAILAILIDFYDLKISLDEDVIKDMDDLSKKEITFIVAYIIETLRYPGALEWFNANVADSLILTHWHHGGKELVNRIFLEKSKQNIKNPFPYLSSIYEALANSISENLTEENISIWFKGLSFPREYVNILNLALKETKVSCGVYGLSQLPDAFSLALLSNTFGTMRKSETLIKEMIKKRDFSVFGLHTLDPFYKNFLVVLCYLLLKDDLYSIKDFEKLCFEYRQYFYCEYEILRVAGEFAEFILLVLLSIIYLPELNEDYLEKWKSLMDIVINTLLYPYVAYAEEEEYMWNPEYEFNLDSITTPKYCLNEYLKVLFKSKYCAVADDLFLKLSEYKSAVWPYERPETLSNEPK